MNEDALTEAGLARIWKYSIMPLLTEHFYGQPGMTSQFSLDNLKSATRSNVEATTGEAPQDDGGLSDGSAGPSE